MKSPQLFSETNSVKTNPVLQLSPGSPTVALQGPLSSGALDLLKVYCNDLVLHFHNVGGQIKQKKWWKSVQQRLRYPEF